MLFLSRIVGCPWPGVRCYTLEVNYHTYYCQSFGLFVIYMFHGISKLHILAVTEAYLIFLGMSPCF
jgi:hypothetical protein